MKKSVIAGFAVMAAGLATAQSYKPYEYHAPKPAYTAPTPSYGTGSNYGSTYVAPTIRSDGSFVQGHQRSTANDTKLDNWSTKGNSNPYTGEKGTKNPYKY